MIDKIDRNAVINRNAGVKERGGAATDGRSISEGENKRMRRRGERDSIKRFKVKQINKEGIENSWAAWSGWISTMERRKKRRQKESEREKGSDCKRQTLISVKSAL